MPYLGVKRKVFVSYFSADQREVDVFVRRWATIEGVFIPKVLGAGANYDLIASSNPEYVMSRIRRDFLGDSTVTIVLMGACTHSRRYIDWEIKASLRRGEDDLPNGLIGIILPSQGGAAYLPPRFEQNWNREHRDCYARYWAAPATAQQLGEWIEDAFNARTTRVHQIRNPQEMVAYNSRCRVHGVTH